MGNFSDAEHSVADMVFQSAEFKPLDSLQNAELVRAVKMWECRDDITDPAADLLHLEGTNSFCISYEGISDRHWPSKEATFLSEATVRAALFHEGICNLTDFEPMLVCSRYKLMAVTGSEQLVICPYCTEGGHIAGIVVVSVGTLNQA